MATIEIRDELIQHAREVETLLLGKNKSTMTDAQLIENFIQIGMGKMLADWEHAHQRMEKND